MDPDLKKLKDDRAIIRLMPDLSPLSIVVFGLRSEGYTIKQIIELKIGEILKMNIPDDIREDIQKYIQSTTEYKIFDFLLSNGPSHLYEIGKAVGMHELGSRSGLKANYLRRLVSNGVIDRTDIMYSTTKEKVDAYIASLYLTRFRPAQKSSRQSLYGYFKEAIRSSPNRTSA